MNGDAGTLFGRAVAPYAKAWIAFVGFVLTTVADLWADAPDWVTVVGGVLTAVGVYLVPNASSVSDEPRRVFYWDGK